MPIIIPTKVLDKLDQWGHRLDRAKTFISYLQYFGYLTKDGEFSVQDFIDAIVRLQADAGIHTDGVAGEKTLAVMEWPRCGCTEAQVENATNPVKWGLSNLTYYIEARDTDMGANEWDSILAQALGQWEDVCNLKFTQVTTSSKANLIFGIGAGSRDNFDGASGTLAWAYLPSSTSYKGQLQMKFDTGETWVNQSATRGIRLLNVATHEFGHMLGLSHSSVSSALMAPFYGRDITKPQSNDDIPRIQKLYGKPVTEPIPTPVPTPTPEPNPTPTPGETIIRIQGNVTNVSIDGYRVSKMN